MTTTAEIAAVLPSSRGIVYSYATGISNDGTVIGWEAASNGDEGFEVSNSVVTLLSGDSSLPYAINNSHQVVGMAGSPTGSAYSWLSGQTVNVFPTGTESAALAINSTGTIGGYAAHNGGDEAFLASGSTVTWLGALNNATQTLSIYSEVTGISDTGQAVGWSAYKSIVPLTHAFSWVNGTMTDLGALTGGSDSRANAINGTGIIVGSSDTSTIGVHAVEWQNGSITDLGIPSGFTDSYAQAVNDKGQVVGYAQVSTTQHAILWDNGTSIDLNTLLPANSGWVLQQATGINDQGIIVGNGQYYGQDTAFELSLDGQAAPLATAQAVIQLFRSGQLTTPQEVTDSAGNVSANLDGLQSMAATGDLTSITLNDGGTPTLIMTDHQLSADAGAINKIASAYDLQINVTTANLDFTAPAGHVTSAYFSNPLADYTVTSLTNGAGFTVTGTGIGRDTLENVSSLSFSDGTAIYSGINGQVTVRLLGIGSGEPLCVDNNGDVAGFTGSPSSATTTNAYFWHQGSETLLQPLSGALGGEASHVTDSGLVTGESYASHTLGGSSTAVYWTSSAIGRGDLLPTSIGWLPGDFASLAVSANDMGQIVGESYTTSTSYQGFLWQNGGMISLGSLGGSQIQPDSINDNGQIVGSASLPNGNYHAFSWQNGVMSDFGTLPGDSSSAAQGINSSGTIVGYSSASGSAPYQAVYWSDGQIHKLVNLPGFTSSFANAIDKQGWIVGEEANATGAAAVLWANGTVYNLNSLLPSGGAWLLGDALSINDAGQITGIGSYNGQAAAFELTLPAHLAIAANLALADQYLGLLSGPTPITDSTSAIVSDLTGLQALANAGTLGSITLTDSGTPNISITASQLSTDSTALNDISSAYTLTVAAGSAAASIAGLAGHATTVVFTGAASQYTVTSANGGLTVTGNGVTDHLSNVSALQFSDVTEIVAATPGSASAVTTGNVTELYSAVLAREPDVGGLTFYQNYLLKNPNAPLLQFAEWFLTSSEYTSAHTYAQSSAGDTQFITDSYQNLLGRTPTSDEVNFYLTKVIQPLLANLTPGTQAYVNAELQAHAQMLVYFAGSSEFLGDVQITAANPASAHHWLILI